MAESGERKVTDGGRLLRAHLRMLGISVPDFCEKHGLDRIQVQRVLNGERYKRITVEFAHAIERASDGAIPYTAFLPSTALSAIEASSSESADDSGSHPVATADRNGTEG